MVRKMTEVWQLWEIHDWGNVVSIKLSGVCDSVLGPAPVPRLTMNYTKSVPLDFLIGTISFHHLITEIGKATKHPLI